MCAEYEVFLSITGVEGLFDTGSTTRAWYHGASRLCVRAVAPGLL